MGGMYTHKMLRVKPGIRLELESNLAEANDNKRADNSYCTPCHSLIISVHFLSILSVFFPHISARLSLCLCDPLHLSIYPGAYLSQNFWGSKPKSVSQRVLCPNSKHKQASLPIPYFASDYPMSRSLSLSLSKKRGGGQ